MQDLIQCFFFGIKYDKNNDIKSKGLIGFAIPDLGIIFRSQWNGTLYEIQYAALLSLLKFIESNKKTLAGVQFEILSDSAVVVYQIANKRSISHSLMPFYNTVISYKSKISYRVSWVPYHENIAIVGLPDTPPLKPDFNFNFGNGEMSKLKELGQGHIDLLS